MPNRLLRSPTRTRYRVTRLPTQPCLQATWPWFENDNQFANAGVSVHPPGLSAARYYIQAINNDELVNPAETVYLADSLDYRIGADTVTDAGFPIDGVNMPAGSPFALNEGVAVVLGARHEGKANVL